MGIKKSIEAQLLSIWRALILWCSYHLENLIIEGDFANALASASGKRRPLWRLIMLLWTLGRCIGEWVILDKSGD